jgi:putative transposase
MSWRETCRMDERMRFVLSCEAGEESFAAVCRGYGVSRKTGYKWLERYRASGAVGLVDRSRAPHAHPNGTAEAVCERVIAVRRTHPRWGPKKIRAWLAQREPTSVWPAASTLGNILARADLVVPRRRRRRTPLYGRPFAACEGANDVWCMDFKGWFVTGDGTRVDPLTVSDAASRYLLVCEAVGRADLEHVWPHLARAFADHGLPRAMRSDNGPPFASRAVGGLSRLAVRLIKAGVMPERIAPGKPQENGRHERLHLTLKQETASPPARSLKAQMERFATFRHGYNHDRPHEALGQRPPITTYCRSPRSWDGRLREPEYGGEVEVRRVRSNGEIKWRGDLVFLSETLSGEPVGLRRVDNGSWQIWYGPIRIAGIDHRGRLTRHDSASPTPPKPVDLMDNAAAFPTTPQAQQPPSQT